MIALIGAVFLASLFGSLHCAGMCGAFVGIAMAIDKRPVPMWLLAAAYNGGRLLTYTVLGVISGAVGHAVDLGGSAIGVQRAAIVLSGAMMVAFGGIALMRLRGIRLPAVPLPATWRRLVTACHRAAFACGPVSRALMIGLLTTLMPCGWLYAFAVSAAGTADPLLGAFTMAVFWAGTLPVMVSMGVGVRAFSGLLGARLPYITSILVITIGAYTVAGRATLPSMAGSVPPVEPGDLAAAASAAGQLDQVLPPCCRHDH